MNMKVLSPAGNMESLVAALSAETDEVYLGVKDFNARNIEGFSLETLKEAVNLAHLHNAKVNLAVNILFNNEELQSALDLIVDAYNLGVDAFIIQDIGLIYLIHKHYPEIEIHASTQMGIHNLEGFKELEKLGIKRVVLSRETPIDEIKRINNNSSVEIEYFCQGALCVSFSGNCYMSEYLCNASGNRGKCKQLCRLPYSFIYKDKEIKKGYLLSAKDFNMLESLKDLENAGVDVLKIEGRARRPFYVYTATNIYKTAIKNQPYNEQELMLAFNRGYTNGYFNGNGNIISNKQNHIGINVGKVTKFIKGKNFNKVHFTSNTNIPPKSIIKFIKNNTEVVVTAYDIHQSNNEYCLTTTQIISNNSTVNLISDFDKEYTVSTLIPKRNIQIKIKAQENENIVAEYTINNIKYLTIGETCFSAKTQPLTEQEINANFLRSEHFNFIIECEILNAFLPKQKLNEFRRIVNNDIEKILTKLNKNKLNKIKIKFEKNNKKFSKINKISEKIDDFQYIFNKNEKLLQNKTIIYSPDIYSENDILQLQNKCKKHNQKLFLNTPIFATENDIKILTDLIKKTNVGIIVNNYYALNFNTEKIIGFGMNIYNDVSSSYFNLPSLEKTESIYRMPYMTMLHCPMKSHFNGSCSNCPYKDGYKYRMENGKTFKLKRSKLSSCVFYLTD